MSWNDLRKGRCSQPNREYFITFTTYKRVPLFTNYKAANCFCRLLAVNEVKTQASWLAWVLMPDHFHGLLKVPDGADLSHIIQNLKGRSGYSINKTVGSKCACWQSAYFDRALRRDQDRLAIARYIVANPLRAKLVKPIREYPYWNAVYL